MRIGLISDTHDETENTRKALDVFVRRHMDLIVHCGDWVTPGFLNFFSESARRSRIPVRGVLGNNDTELTGGAGNVGKLCTIEPVSGLLEISDDTGTYAVCHGHEKTLLHQGIVSGAYRAIFTGHTHIPRNEISGVTRIINPGTVSPRLAHIKGLEPTVGVFDTESGICEIILV